MSPSRKETRTNDTAGVTLAKADEAPGGDPSGDQEELRKMSFGDHLDELRRRMIICAVTLFVCVGGMLFFKDRVTEIYIEPYQIMWRQAYLDFLARREAEFAASVGSTDPHKRKAAADYLSREKVDEILTGGYARPAELRDVAGFDAPYPAKDSPQWQRFADEFRLHAKNTRRQRDRLHQLIWHRERQEEILAGEFDDRAELIYTQSGFPLHKTLMSTRPLEDFWTFMAACLLFACMLASPVLLWQAWAFIGAGLYAKERRVVYRALPFAIALLLAGVAFGFFVMVPYGFYFLAQLMNWTMITPLFTVADYFKFLLTLTVALGLVFQLPILMVALQKVGILRLVMMKKHWRWVVLTFFLVSAMLTPPDPVTQILMVTPMLSLFLLGMFLMWRVEVKQRKSGAFMAPPSGDQA